MNATRRSTNTQSISVSTQGLAETLGCGRVTAIKIGEAAQAKMKVGRRVLWNLDKIRGYLSEVSE